MCLHPYLPSSLVKWLFIVCSCRLSISFFFPLLNFEKPLCTVDNISCWINYLQIFSYNLFLVFSLSQCVFVSVCAYALFLHPWIDSVGEQRLLIWRGSIYCFFFPPMDHVFEAKSKNSLPFPEFKVSPLFSKNKKN